MIPAFGNLFERDLNRLETELNAYRNEADLWKLSGEINNSPGNLALHLIGNLRHFIGHVLGGTDYQRDRDAEFGNKNVPRDQILADLEVTKEEVAQALEKLRPEQLEEDFPVKVMNMDFKTGHFLIHLYGHLNYHLGQINYHPRIVVGG